jgi:PAS domain S-box-containing protein
MAWQFNIYAVILIFLAIPLLWIAHLAWGQRHELAPRVFLIHILLSLGLVVSYAGELFSANLNTIMFWVRLEYLFESTLIVYLIFALAYAGFTELIKPFPIASLFILPIFVWVAVWMNENSRLIWTDTGTRVINGLVMFERTYGPMFWVWLVYLHLITAAATIILIWAARRKHRLYQGQIAVVLIGTLIPWGALVLTVTGLTPFPLLDLVPYGIALQAIPLTYGLFHFRLLDILPVAYRHITEHTSDILIVYDRHQRVLEANPAALNFLGMPAQDIIGKPLQTVTPPPLHEDYDTPKETIRTVTLDGSPRRLLEVQTIPIMQTPTTPQSHILIIRDQTQLLALETERQRTELMEGFLRNVSHDFRTRLTLITTSHYIIGKLLERSTASLTALRARNNGTVEGADTMVKTLENIHQRLKLSETGAFEISRILENMLDLIRLENQADFTFEPTNLNDLASDESARICAKLTHKKVNLSFHGDYTLPKVNIDSWEIRRMLGHLLDNAFQFTPEGRGIKLRTYRSGDEAVIEVKDEGIGIESADLPHIFERMYRADKSRQAETGGSGLGLTIVKRIVDAHSGRITVDSTPGAGSTFRVYLPLAKVQ